MCGQGKREVLYRCHTGIHKKTFTVWRSIHCTASEAEEKQIKEIEGKRLLAKVRDSMYVIALDLKGKEYDSVSFSQMLSQKKTHGKSHIAFVIGGSLGLSEEVLNRADERVCFSKMTFTHQLMRVILLEQLYRACRIEMNEPYHK